MKTISFLLIFAFLFDSQTNDRQPKNSVNSILGDISFITKYGFTPDENLDEDLRITTHLEYVLKILQKRDVSHLTKAQTHQRTQNIKHLEEYIASCIYPRNYDYEGERKPYFIDRDGRICAVGYLVEQTAGRELAEEINTSFQYEKIADMESESLEKWIEESGLTKEECAMIQPSYQGLRIKRYTNKTLVASGINTSIMALNGINMIRGKKRRWIPILGMASGIAHTYWGYKNILTEEEAMDPASRFHYYEFLQVRNRTRLNMAVGSATFFLSASNLLFNKYKKDKSVCWSFYGLPQKDHSFELGLHLAKRF